jgi:hypothetical protein
MQLLDYNKWAPNCLHPERVDCLRSDLHFVFTKLAQADIKTFQEFAAFWECNELGSIHSLMVEGESKLEYYQIIYELVLLDFAFRT